MLDWIRRWLTTRTPQSITGNESPLERAFLAQQRMIEEILRKQQATIDAQQQTIDRVVALHYDRPIARPAAPASAPQMPDFMMSDQGDVRPLDAGPADEIGAALNRIGAESDSEFLGV